MSPTYKQYIDVVIHQYIHSYINTYIHAYINTYIHQYIHTYINRRVVIGTRQKYTIKILVSVVISV